MKRFNLSAMIPVLALFALLTLITSTLTGCGTSSAVGTQTSTNTPSTSATWVANAHYIAKLLPLNASGVSGIVHLDVTGTVLTINIQAKGLEPNKEHYQHIHGNSDGTVSCPTAADENSSGIITVDQGLSVVGPVALDLLPYAQVTGPGTITWSHTYTLTPEDIINLIPLTGHVIVLHGMAYQGVYDRAVFVACGPIQLA